MLDSSRTIVLIFSGLTCGVVVAFFAASPAYGLLPSLDDDMVTAEAKPLERARVFATIRGREQDDLLVLIRSEYSVNESFPARVRTDPLTDSIDIATSGVQPSSIDALRVGDVVSIDILRNEGPLYAELIRRRHL